MRSVFTIEMRRDCRCDCFKLLERVYTKQTPSTLSDRRSLIGAAPSDGFPYFGLDQGPISGSLPRLCSALLDSPPAFVQLVHELDDFIRLTISANRHSICYNIIDRGVHSRRGLFACWPDIVSAQDSSTTRMATGPLT